MAGGGRAGAAHPPPPPSAVPFPVPGRNVGPRLPASATPCEAPMGKRILLIVGGGIAAYKACELIRLLRKRGHAVRCVLTEAGAEFITPMTLAALSEQPVHTSLFDLKDEAEMGHIQLSREADLVVVCPGTAEPDRAHGERHLRRSRHHAAARHRQADPGGARDERADVAAPRDPAQCRAAPRRRHGGDGARRGHHGVRRIWPRPPARAAGDRRGDRARARPADPRRACSASRPPRPRRWPDGRLTGKRILVTAGPTHEPIDPVRYIANRSSGKQGFAIAGALARLGAQVTLVAGPVAWPRPPASPASMSRPRARWPPPSRRRFPPTSP